MKYTLYQNGTRIAESATGEFELETQTFKKGAGVYVKTEDRNGNYFINNLLLEFYAVEFVKDYVSLNLGNLSIGAPDWVPFIGGSKVDVNLPVTIPITASVSDGKIRFGFGFSNNKSEKERLQNIDDTRNLIKELGSAGLNKPGRLTPAQDARFKELVKGTDPADAVSFLKPIKVRVLGYAEMDFGKFGPDAELQKVTGNFIIQFTCDAVDVNWTTWCVVVPITINMKLTMGLNTSVTMIYDLQTETLDGNLMISPFISFNIFGGIGVGRVAAVGAYGNATLQADFEVLPQQYCQQVSLTGEMGLKAYVWIFSYTKTFAKNTWNIYTNPNHYKRGGEAFDGDDSYIDALNGMNDTSQYIEASLSYLENEGDWISDRDQYVTRG